MLFCFVVTVNLYEVAIGKNLRRRQWVDVAGLIELTTVEESTFIIPEISGLHATKLIVADEVGTTNTLKVHLTGTFIKNVLKTVITLGDGMSTVAKCVNVLLGKVCLSCM